MEINSHNPCYVFGPWHPITVDVLYEFMEYGFEGSENSANEEETLDDEDVEVHRIRVFFRIHNMFHRYGPPIAAHPTVSKNGIK